MQIQLLLQPEKELVIPFNYNHQLQSALYAKMREGGGGYLHDEGYGEDRDFKAFVFGALKGEHRKEDKHFRFTGTVNLEVRSPVFELCDILQRGFERNPVCKLFDTRLTVVGASLGNVHFPGGREILHTVSPVAVYRTEPDGKTTFFSPDQPEFVPYLIANYENKYHAILGGEPEPVTIEPMEPQRRIVTRFKEKWMTCYKGNYALTGSSQALEFIYNTGLGVKNSAGFGMLEKQ